MSSGLIRPRWVRASWKPTTSCLRCTGPQGWWPARHSFEMCAGAILVQNTAWPNARKALDNLRSSGADSVVGVLAISEATLAGLIRRSGYFNQKAAKLAGFCEYVAQNYAADLGQFLSLPMVRLRAELLDLWGIGPETRFDRSLRCQATFFRDGYVHQPVPGTYGDRSPRRE